MAYKDYNESGNEFTIYPFLLSPMSIRLIEFENSVWMVYCDYNICVVQTMQQYDHSGCF